jgi:hypothetical protein
MKKGAPPGSYRTQSADTSIEAEQAVFSRLRELRPWQKADLLRAPNRSARALALAGLRSRHPGAGDDELRLRLAGQILGREELSRVLAAEPRHRTP